MSRRPEGRWGRGRELREGVIANVTDRGSADLGPPYRRASNQGLRPTARSAANSRLRSGDCPASGMPDNLISKIPLTEVSKPDNIAPTHLAAPTRYIPPILKIIYSAVRWRDNLELMSARNILIASELSSAANHDRLCALLLLYHN